MTGKGETLRSAQGGHLLPGQGRSWLGAKVFDLFVGEGFYLFIWGGWFCFVLKQFVNISTEHHAFIFKTQNLCFPIAKAPLLISVNI